MICEHKNTIILNTTLRADKRFRAGLSPVARISRPTLRKGWRRYPAQGEAGLQEISRRPHKILSPKVTENYEKLILEFRRSRNLKARPIPAELIRQNNFKLSTKTLEKILRRNNVLPIGRHKNKQKIHRYSGSVAGERIRIDTIRIADGSYQYTAIDDCSRFRVLGIYLRRTAKNSVHFLEERMIARPTANKVREINKSLKLKG